MATDIHIKNFQSIKDLHIKVDGFTVLIGKNNIGKSAVIRAIKAALDNQTGNKAHIRRGEKAIEVHVSHPNIDFKWSKGEDETSYEVTEPGKEKQVYTKLNGSVPAPIINAGYDKISIDSKMESPLIASQFKELFLLDKRGSVITEVLTALYDMDVITIADEKCQKDLKSNKAQLKTREADLKTVQSSLEKYKDIEAIKSAMKIIVGHDTVCKELQEEIRILSEYERELNTIEESVNRLKGINGVKIPDIIKLDSAVAEFGWLDEKDKELVSRASSFKKLKGITKVKVPELDDSLAMEIRWLIDKELELNLIQADVDRFKKIEEIKIPVIHGVGEILDETLLIKAWDDKVTGLHKRLSTPVPDLSTIFDSITKIEAFVQDFAVFTENEQSLIAKATTTKALRNELSVVTATLTEKKSEMDLIKACPLCDRPFHD